MQTSHTDVTVTRYDAGLACVIACTLRSQHHHTTNVLGASLVEGAVPVKQAALIVGLDAEWVHWRLCHRSARICEHGLLIGLPSWLPPGVLAQHCIPALSMGCLQACMRPRCVCGHDDVCVVVWQGQLFFP